MTDETTQAGTPAVSAPDVVAAHGVIADIEAKLYKVEDEVAAEFRALLAKLKAHL